jgi:hypothetical protein
MQLRIGIRQGLSAIMTASLIFTAAGVPELSDMQLGSTWINLAIDYMNCIQLP